jgi:chromate reductase, NAD(P)H dehydrogenase (quinone)
MNEVKKWKTVLRDRRNLRILAIPGSLRAASTNAVLLDSAACLAPESVHVVVYRGLGALPHFNPDLDNDLLHGPVPELRSQLRNSDGILFSTPEYAHGIPGALKNALDWMVGSGELYDKPVALFNTSSRAIYAQASLTGTLKVMAARLISEAFITVPLLGRNLSKDSIVSDPELSRMIRSALAAFVSAI